MKTNPNQTAMPIHGGFNETGECFDDPRNGVIQGGLTKREHFAAMAMQRYVTAEHDRLHGNIAKDAVAMADALIKALNETSC